MVGSPGHIRIYKGVIQMTESFTENEMNLDECKALTKLMFNTSVDIINSHFKDEQYAKRNPRLIQTLIQSQTELFLKNS